MGKAEANVEELVSEIERGEMAGARIETGVTRCRRGWPPTPLTGSKRSPLCSGLDGLNNGNVLQ